MTIESSHKKENGDAFEKEVERVLIESNRAYISKPIPLEALGKNIKPDFLTNANIYIEAKHHATPGSVEDKMLGLVYQYNRLRKRVILVIGGERGEKTAKKFNDLFTKEFKYCIGVMTLKEFTEFMGCL